MTPNTQYITAYNDCYAHWRNTHISHIGDLVWFTSGNESYECLRGYLSNRIDTLNRAKRR